MQLQMSTIDINVDEFDKAASLFIMEADECKAEMEKIERITADLLLSWEGKSKDAFSEKFEQIKKEMSLNESKIREMSDKIKIVARNFQQADDEVVRMVKNGI